MRKTKIKRIGIFGGTFNPPHAGHLIVAEYVRQRLKLDTIVFIPSYISPHKQKGEERLAFHRLKMVRSAIRGNPFFSSSNAEIKRKGPSYSFETVETFRRLFPEAKLFLIIGADNFVEFSTWKNPQRILSAASLVVMNRPSFTLTGGMKKMEAVEFVSVPDIQISSTDIRAMIRKGKSIRFLVPEAVERYIARHRLYRNDR